MRASPSFLVRSFGGEEMWVKVGLRIPAIGMESACSREASALLVEALLVETSGCGVT